MDTIPAGTNYWSRRIRAEWVNAGEPIETLCESEAPTGGSLVWVQGLALPVFVENQTPGEALDIGRDIVEELYEK